jgi:hypothetical protein
VDDVEEFSHFVSLSRYTQILLDQKDIYMFQSVLILLVRGSLGFPGATSLLALQLPCDGSLSIHTTVSAY